MENNYVLFVGPYPPPIHGQSFAFQLAYDNYLGLKILISQNFESRSKSEKLFLTVISLIKYCYIFSTKRISIVYLAGSRSLFGSFKDVVLINIAKWKGVKVINHIHAAYFDKFLDSLPRIIKNSYVKAYRKVDLFIYLLQEMKSEYLEFESSSKLEFVPNFYDPVLEEFHVDDLKLSNNLVISYFSNIVYSKGIFDLIKAFNILCKKYSDVQLQIAGSFASDSYKSITEVKKLFNEYLQTNVRISYKGSLTGKAKMEFLKNSQILVLPSFYSSEAVPISILEAMRMGNAIVVSNHHYLPILVGTEKGSVFEIGNITQLAENLEQFILDPQKLNSTRIANIKFAENNFRMKAYTDKINSIIDQNKS